MQFENVHVKINVKCELIEIINYLFCSSQIIQQLLDLPLQNISTTKINKCIAHKASCDYFQTYMELIRNFKYKMPLTEKNCLN